MRNKLIGSMVVVFVLTALTATSVFAQGDLLSISNVNGSIAAPPPPGGGFKLTDEALQAAADVLGITVDELSAALEEGTTLEELAATAGVDVKDVFDAIHAVMPGPGKGFGGQNGQPGQPGQMHLSDDALGAAADALGMTADELSAALEEGSTLQELAESAGVDFRTVMDAIREAMPAPQGQPGQGQPGQMQLSDDALDAAADALGMTADELSAALEDGSTLQDLAESAGVDFRTVMDAIREAMPAPNGQSGQGQGQMPGGQPGQGVGGPPPGDPPPSSQQ